MDNFKTLDVSIRSNGVATVKMSRPDVFNAFDEAMIGELGAAFTALKDNEEVRIVVLAGQGKHFSAGADLNWMKRASQSGFEWNLDDSRRFAGMLYGIASFPKPTITGVQGVALGGGVGLICACDIAIACDTASFAVSEARFGILPSVIGPYLTNAVGKRQAKRLALTTERISAAEALSIGLVQLIVNPELLDETIDKTVENLLIGGPNAQSEIKTLFAGLSVGPITPEIRELTAQTISRVRATDEAKEGFDAFLSKRPANWIKQ